MFRSILDVDIGAVLRAEPKIFAELHSTQENKTMGVLASVMKQKKDIETYKLNTISGKLEVKFLIVKKIL